MRSILCYLLFAIGGTVTYVCAEEKEQIGSDTLENILFVDDLFFCFHADLAVAPSASLTTRAGGSSRIRFCGEAVRRTSDE